MGEPTEIIIGIDIGGTSTRAIVVGHDGVVGPIARFPGANPSTRTIAELADITGSAVQTAIHGFKTNMVGEHTIIATAIGMAGLDPTRRLEFEALLGDVVRAEALRLNVVASRTLVPILHTDAEIMFAAGSATSTGLVLIAGTGAIAARITGWRETATVDGHGWRLGDHGSGHWIGAAVLRRVLDDLDERDTPTAMTSLVTQRLGLTPGAADSDTSLELRWAIVRATTSMHPSEIAAFSDVAIAAHADGDPAAVAVIDAAAGELIKSTLALRPGPEEPIVLGGGMLTTGPLLDALTSQLERRSLRAMPLSVEPVMGAVRIAKAAAEWLR